MYLYVLIYEAISQQHISSICAQGDIVSPPCRYPVVRMLHIVTYVHPLHSSSPRAVKNIILLFVPCAL
jgi:hypothetical protein